MIAKKEELNGAIHQHQETRRLVISSSGLCQTVCDNIMSAMGPILASPSLSYAVAISYYPLEICEEL